MAAAMAVTTPSGVFQVAVPSGGEPDATPGSLVRPLSSPSQHRTAARLATPGGEAR